MNKGAKGRSKAYDEQEVSNYLNAIAFMLSQNLSYAQTENILKNSHFREKTRTRKSVELINLIR